MHAPQIVSALVLFTATAALNTGCQPDPVYDDELDLQAVSVEPGSMAGTWAQKHSVVNIAHLPLIGEQDAGGETYVLVERTYDDSGEYTQLSQVCGGRTYDVGGTATILYDEQWRSVTPMTIEKLEIDEALGTFVLKDHIQMWGYDMEDTVNGDFPETREEANADPFVDHIVDGDNDDNPGITMELEGFINGEAYFIQRKRIELGGVIVDEDTHKGLIDDFLQETVTVGTTDDLLDGELERTPHDDPRQMWYQETRIDDGMDCDEMVEFIKDGGLPRLNPFLADG